MKNLASAAIAALLLAATANIALAQGDDFDLETDDSFGAPSEAEPAADPAAGDTSSAPSSTSGYEMGISTAFPTGGDSAAANLLWGLDAETFLNIRFGFDFNKGTVVDGMGMETSETRVGTTIGAGYRMYKPTEGRIRPYIEPGGFVSINDFSAFGDTLSLGAYATMGVDFQVVDQFTLGVGLGGALIFADSFDTISLGLFTNNINATFWW